MDPTVIVESGAAVEGFATLLALVGSHARVNSVVGEEVREVPERFAARVTLVGFLSRVDSLVLHKVEGLVEGFPAFLAFEVVFALSGRLALWICGTACVLCFSWNIFPRRRLFWKSAPWCCSC